eukprot:698352-Prorocentrum_minimum.AAC.2
MLRAEHKVANSEAEALRLELRLLSRAAPSGAISLAPLEDPSRTLPSSLGSSLGPLGRARSGDEIWTDLPAGDDGRAQPSLPAGGGGGGPNSAADSFPGDIGRADANAALHARASRARPPPQELLHADPGAHPAEAAAAGRGAADGGGAGEPEPASVQDSGGGGALVRPDVDAGGRTSASSGGGAAGRRRLVLGGSIRNRGFGASIRV